MKLQIKTSLFITMSVLVLSSCTNTSKKQKTDTGVKINLSDVYNLAVSNYYYRKSIEEFSLDFGLTTQNTILQGTADPTKNLGSNNQFYINTDTFEYFEKQTTWNSKGRIRITPNENEAKLTSIKQTTDSDLYTTYTVTFESTKSFSPTFAYVKGDTKDYFYVPTPSAEGYGVKVNSKGDWVINDIAYDFKAASTAVVQGKSGYTLYRENFSTYTKSETEWVSDLVNGNLGNKVYFTVNFNSNGGSSVPSQQVEKDHLITKPEDPTRSSYTFVNWVDATNTEWDFEKDKVTCDLTLKAIWYGESPSPIDYYKDADTSTPQKLIESLETITGKNYNKIEYDGLYNAYETTDLKPGTNIIWDMYSNEEFVIHGPKENHSYNKEGDGYNREHSIPQSWFNKASPMKSDLFQVYPTDGYVNNMRGNYPFAEVGTASYVSNNGSKRGTSCSPGISGTVFEPIDEYKGDFARTYFYMAARYRSKVGNWSGDVFSGSFPYLEDAFASLYLSWHLADPVSDKEINRNNAVYELQKNRNPFIDNPSWAEYIFG